ncbi:MAG: T9SS type A sorting domain-containing protein [Bacteroidales bacterium]|nr:T9SS type A sorting domain-containing protein [Bacteroidales bacterium]MBN2698390.1 T9SS type A sorting domain-containing protein [Bacteroidales bacterium]
MRQIKTILCIIGCGLITALNGQTWIPHTIGIGGVTDSAVISCITGQPYVSAGDGMTGLGNLLWLPEDTLFTYRLGEIPEKTVYHNADCRFRFYWDGHPDAEYSYKVWNRYDTTLLLSAEEQKAVFNYTPLITDVSNFEVEFIGIDGDDTLSQMVFFTPLPENYAEQEIITYMKDMEYIDTILVSKIWSPEGPMNFNGEDTVVRIDIIGKTVVFENGNIPFTYQGISNLKELNIYATKVIIRDSVHFPQTRVRIFCEDLVFEDLGNRISCINSTPRTPTLAGFSGLDASEFFCYCRRLESTGNHLRFFVNGGQGSPSLMIPGTDNFSAPGGGGNGGNFYSNINLKPVINLAGGCYGTPTDWKQPPIGPRGIEGHYVFEPNCYSWLHPHAVRFMLQYARESYIYGQPEMVNTTCEKYINLIKSYKKTESWNNDTVAALDLEQLYYSFSALKHQLDENLDYFGNPKGWAPLLSFEANLQNYQNEIEFAIRVLYLDYWMSNKAKTLQQKQETAELIKDKAIDQITILQVEYEEAYQDYIPALKEFKDICAKQDSLTVLYNQQIDWLIKEAEDNVANSFEGIFRRVGMIVGQVCSCIPGPATQILGSAIQTAAQFDYEDPLSMDNWNLVHETLTLAVDEFSTVVDNASGLAGGINPASLIEAGAKQGAHNAKKVLDNLSPENLQKFASTLKKVTIPDDKVKAEFERLKKGYPIFDIWLDSIESYTMKKGEVAQVMAFSQQKLNNIPQELTKMLLVCDAMDDILLSSDNILDPRAMTYLNEMKRTAWERMVRYHYYLAMAYQYRFLEPYPEPLNLRPLFESFDTLATYNAEISPEQYSALLPIFENQIRTISDEIYTAFNDGTYSEFNEPVTYTLSDGQLDELNAKGELRINVWNSGKIPRQYVDCRITDISVVKNKLKISQDTILSDATLTILMAHSGNSALIHPSSGEHFMFSQYNDDAAVYYNTSSMSPLGWAEKYFFYDGHMSTVERSLASESLIRKILDVAGDEDLMIFTRPAAWAEIKIITDLHTGEQADMNVSIDSLTLLINIDYRATTKFSNVLVSCSDELMPLFNCNKADLNNRTYGWGNFTRSYSRTAGTVKFTAPQEYGIYTFDKWKKSTSTGYEETSNPEVSVDAGNHTWITANYKLNVPFLEVPDTLYALWSQGTIDIPVKNGNIKEHLPMEWFSITECEWFSIKEGTHRGVENGTISLNLTLNTGKMRTGTVTVFAFSAANPEQVVTIIQNKNPTKISERTQDDGFEIYPNPAENEIFVDLPDRLTGEPLTISVVSMDGRIFHVEEIAYGSTEPLRVSLETVPCGMYILEVKGAGENWYRKFTRGR